MQVCAEQGVANVLNYVSQEQRPTTQDFDRELANITTSFFLFVFLFGFVWFLFVLFFKVEGNVGLILGIQKFIRQ